jgi:hypothetical protein
LVGWLVGWLAGVGRVKVTCVIFVGQCGVSLWTCISSSKVRIYKVILEASEAANSTSVDAPYHDAEGLVEAFDSTILRGRVGAGWFNDIAVFRDVLPEVFGAGEFTTLVTTELGRVVGWTGPTG